MIYCKLDICFNNNYIELSKFVLKFREKINFKD